jgi:hypothetical protein
MSEVSEPIAVDAPPLADRPPQRDESVARLRRLATELSRSHDRRHLIEYLRLRRALR